MWLVVAPARLLLRPISGVPAWRAAVAYTGHVFVYSPALLPLWVSLGPRRMDLYFYVSLYFMSKCTLRVNRACSTLLDQVRHSEPVVCSVLD